MLIDLMLRKYYPPTYVDKEISIGKIMKSKRSLEMKLKYRNKKKYGEHYNYNIVGICKNKKYLLEEQKNTQIERQNRILFEKIRKIGPRSAQSQPITRVSTQVVKPEFIQSKFIQKDTPQRSTYQQRTISKFTYQKITPHYRKLLFQGLKRINRVQFKVLIYIEDDKYMIKSEQGNMHHKIQMSLSDYQSLLMQKLEEDHFKIFDLLTFNGTLLGLKGAHKENIGVVQEEVALPLIERSKPRFQTQ